MKQCMKFTDWCCEFRLALTVLAIMWQQRSEYLIKLRLGMRRWPHCSNGVMTSVRATFGFRKKF
jgi:uncharacterized membrane protein